MITKSGQFSIGDKVVWQFGGGVDEIVRFGRNGTHAFLSGSPGVAVPVAELSAIPAAPAEVSGGVEKSQAAPLEGCQASSTSESEAK